MGDAIEGVKSLYTFAEKYLGPTPSNDLIVKAGFLGSQIYLDAKGTFGRFLDTGKYMVKAVKDAFVRDVINGDAKSRSQFISYVGTSFGIGLLGDKGLSKIGEAGAAAGKIGRIVPVEGIDAHHVGQKALMKDFVENYDLNTAPAINVPKVGHTIKGPNGIVSRSTKYFVSSSPLLLY